MFILAAAGLSKIVGFVQTFGLSFPNASLSLAIIRTLEIRITRISYLLTSFK